MNNFDTIIIGKGPAGISAALYLARAKKKVLVIGKDTGSLGKAELIENYYGLAQPITGEQLAEIGISQAQKLGVQVLTAEATELETSYGDQNSGYRVTVHTLENTEHYEAKTVLIAAGKQRTGLKVAGFEEYKGKGISFCAVCDGFFYRKKKIAVIGSGAYAGTELQHLYEMTKEITLFTNGEPLEIETVPADVVINTDIITRIIGAETVSGIETKNKETGKLSVTDVQGIFTAIGTAGAADFALKLGIQTGSGPDAGTIIVDNDMRTGVPGIYAAGDAVGGYLQIVKAAADGAIAAKTIMSDLRKLL